MTASGLDMATFLGDYFGIEEALFESYGAINISVVNDLPLFIPLPAFSQREARVRGAP